MSSQVTQEVQDVLLISRAQHIELTDHLVGFRPRAGVLLDRLYQITGAPIMQEEGALPDAPQRSATEHEAIGVALRHSISKSASHVVYRVVAERVDCHIGRPSPQGRISGCVSHGVTSRAADIDERL